MYTEGKKMNLQFSWKNRNFPKITVIWDIFMGENSFKKLVPIYESTRRTYATISIDNTLITTSVTVQFPFQIGNHKIIKKNYSSETSVSSLIYSYVALCLLKNKNTGHDLLKWWVFVSK